MKKGDTIIIALLIILSVLSFRTIKSGESISISADGREFIYPADEDRTVQAEGPLGITTIEIKNGEAHITDSPCPNKTCMKQSIGNTITCLPNRIVIVNPEKTVREVDTVAY